MDKKGIITVALFIAGLFALILSYIVISSSSREERKEAIIGEKQSTLIKFYLDAEEIMLNIEESARLSQAKAIKELYKNPGCSMKEGYILLEECTFNKKQLEDQFIKFLRSHLKDYLNELEEVYNLHIAQEDYSFAINEGILEGTTEKAITLKKDGIEYSFSPNFKVKTNLTIEQLIQVMVSLKEKKACLATYNELEGEKKLIDRCDLKEFDTWSIVKKDKDLLLRVKKNIQSIFNTEIDTAFTITF